MLDLITIGDSIIDTFLIIDEKSASCNLSKDLKLLCFNYADKIPISKSDQSVGGNAANVAVGAHRLGLKSAIVTEIGDDINGHVIEDGLKKAGVDASMIRIVKNAESRYSVVLNYKSERTILSYHAKRNYNLPKLSKTKWIYYTSLGKTFDRLQKQLINHLIKNPQIKLAMNPGSYQINKGLVEIHQALKHCHLLIVNKQEADKINGKKKDLKLACRSLHSLGPSIIVITDGINGSYASDGNNIYHLPASPVKAIAKTGAGDAYTSGFLSAIIYNKSLTEAMQWGTANASGVIQKIGAQKGLLTKTGIQKIVKNSKKLKPKLI